MGGMKSHPSSSSEVPGVVGAPSLEAPSVEDEAESAGERGASSPNMSSASSIEKVYAERVIREGSNCSCCEGNWVGRAVVGEWAGDISMTSSFSGTSGMIWSGGGRVFRRTRPEER